MYIHVDIYRTHIVHFLCHGFLVFSNWHSELFALPFHRLTGKEGSSATRRPHGSSQVGVM